MGTGGQWPRRSMDGSQGRRAVLMARTQLHMGGRRAMRGPSSKCADGMRGDAKTAFARLCTVRDGDRAPFEGRWVVASSPLLRLRGLAGRRPDSTVMGFPRCRDVHTLTMRHPLDVAFLDRRGRVIAVHRLVLPGARLRCGRAWAVVERFARPGRCVPAPRCSATQKAEGARSRKNSGRSGNVGRQRSG